MWYKITGTIAIILIVILLILLFCFLKGTGNDKKRRNLLKYIILLFLLLVLDIPFVINESYKFGKWYSTVWGGEDVLQYFGAVLSFIGTLFLGYIAILQNNRITNIEEKVYNRNSSSDIVIDNSEQLQKTLCLSNENNGSEDFSQEIEFNIANYGQAVLNSVKFIFVNGKVYESNLTLPQGQKVNVIIDIPKSSKQNDLVNVVFTSCYGVKTYGRFKLSSRQNKEYIKDYCYYGLDKEVL